MEIQQIFVKVRRVAPIHPTTEVTGVLGEFIKTVKDFDEKASATENKGKATKNPNMIMFPVPRISSFKETTD